MHKGKKDDLFGVLFCKNKHSQYRLTPSLHCVCVRLSCSIGSLSYLPKAHPCNSGKVEPFMFSFPLLPLSSSARVGQNARVWWGRNEFLWIISQLSDSCLSSNYEGVRRNSLFSLARLWTFFQYKHVWESMNSQKKLDISQRISFFVILSAE